MAAMHALIVLAHPEPQSFNGRLARAATEELTTAAHTVDLLDLYATGFDPVEGPRHFPARAHPTHFDTQREQRAAYDRGMTAADVDDVLERLKRAELLVLQYPLWWWGPPAIMKGFIDRAFVYGGLYTSTTRFEHGPLAGRRALVSVTLGANAGSTGFDGKEGDTRLVLWPMLISLRYVGYDVLEPLITTDIHGVMGDTTGEHAARLDAIEQDGEDRLRATLREYATAPTFPFNVGPDFDDDGRLVPGAPAHTPFIRHRETLALD